jgi:hypothetical protein
MQVNAIKSVKETNGAAGRIDEIAAKANVFMMPAGCA